ncbi:hypothetical protein P9E76_21520 [Schinkia azotoformans]|uniref:hypothetical protein n=1 Tax=Schinkia azotoformans TaxID=1454 RepID=UPI002DBEE1EE|nr:hypothetical protein [Schinkia azotoformans]MEC1638955.1 hypothetical protein [Schinkia azotoformans]MEC1722344.1 hypothetical protein [Schinkia azotoformans]MEC1947574.1 hypothetical protein [Schinkia azotoformans]MED4355085.1 hypothetical protein [Schinkia azotoformans]MED4414560.1 hypothetical protein [Schinkia azotoformans]
MDRDKEFSRLKRRTTKLINKCDEKGIEFTDLEIVAFSKVGHAESMLDVSWLVKKQQLERIFEKYKVR